jgi:hypothetical protein
MAPTLREIGLTSLKFEHDAERGVLGVRDSDDEIVHTQSLALPEGVQLEILPGKYSNYLKLTGAEFKPPVNYDERTSDFLLVGLDNISVGNRRIGLECLGSYAYQGRGEVQDTLDDALREEWGQI